MGHATLKSSVNAGTRQRLTEGPEVFLILVSISAIGSLIVMKGCLLINSSVYYYILLKLFAYQDAFFTPGI